MLSVQRERVAGLGMEPVLHHHAVGLADSRVPNRPADEAVNRVCVLGLGERELVPATLELVLSVL